MPIAFSVDHAHRMVHTVATGSVTSVEILKHLEQERDDRGLGFPELIDATQASVDRISGDDIRRIVDRLRDLSSQQALGPTAIVTRDDVSYGMIRMLETLVDDVADVRPFRSLAEAEGWLNAPP